MKYIPEYTEQSVVHHKDENKQNNNLENLEVFASKAEHARFHNKDNLTLKEYTQKHGPHNKGKKMSKEFCEKCSVSAKKRGFVGNQYVDANGNQR